MRRISRHPPGVPHVMTRSGLLAILLLLGAAPGFAQPPEP